MLSRTADNLYWLSRYTERAEQEVGEGWERPPRHLARVLEAQDARGRLRALARELGVEIRLLSGTGPGGRISEEDVQAFVRSALSGGGAYYPAPRHAACQADWMPPCETRRGTRRSSGSRRGSTVRGCFPSSR
jgi:pyruvate/2-oxoglutarate dehydrogenase complex dihydrolipoamide acyltransferase (E2) component